LPTEDRRLAALRLPSALDDRRKRTDVLLFGALLAAGLVAMASQFEWISDLFVGEVAFQAIFLILLTRAIADPALTGPERA
jgi:hypothetical protein